MLRKTLETIGQLTSHVLRSNTFNSVLGGGLIAGALIAEPLVWVALVYIFVGLALVVIAARGELAREKEYRADHAMYVTALRAVTGLYQEERVKNERQASDEKSAERTPDRDATA